MKFVMTSPITVLIVFLKKEMILFVNLICFDSSVHWKYHSFDVINLLPHTDNCKFKVNYRFHTSANLMKTTHGTTNFVSLSHVVLASYFPNHHSDFQFNMTLCRG